MRILIRTFAPWRSLPAAALALLIAGAPSAAQNLQDVAREDERVPQAAVLGALDKITARVSTIEAPIDAPVEFGTLKIVARTCYKTPPEERPEVTAFLEIDDVRRPETPERFFSGWMFASSPAVSALEHPVYDVWVTDCKMALPESDSGRE